MGGATDGEGAVTDTPAPSKFIADVDGLKRAKLRDIISRVMANPQNAAEVAEEIALDWFPMVRVDPKGNAEIVVGSGCKR